MRRLPRLLPLALGCVVFGVLPLRAQTTYNVGTEAALRSALASLGNGDTVNFTANITLNAVADLNDLPVLQASNITINGGGFTLDGSSTYRGFFVYSGSVAINGLTLANTSAVGGQGVGDGGSGMGAGGGLFVKTGASVTLTDVAFSANSAASYQGIHVGVGNEPSGGGGGGLGGSSGVAATTQVGSGGGGIGRKAEGGPGGHAGSGGEGIVIGVPSVMGGTSYDSYSDGGGGGGGGFATSEGGGGGGGIGGGVGSAAEGGAGGFGGGGGAGYVFGSGGIGGNGGFGGGGAGGDGFGGGLGGYGGGGARNDRRGGFGGSAGESVITNASGAGLAAGGAVFVMEGATLLIQGTLTQTAGTATGDGYHAGSALFMQGNGTLNFAPGSGKTQSIANDITDEVGTGFPVVASNGNPNDLGGGTGVWGLAKSDAGTLILGGTNTFTGATTVSAGQLTLNGSTMSATTIGTGATLGGSGTFHALATIEDGGILAPGNSPGTLTFTAGLALNDGTVLDFQLGHPASDLVLVTGGILTGPASAAGATFYFSDAGGFTAGTYTLIDGTGAVLDGFDATKFTGGGIAGYSFVFSLTGDELSVTATAIPEPATYAALAGLLALGLAVVRRRRA